MIYNCLMGYGLAIVLVKICASTMRVGNGLDVGGRDRGRRSIPRGGWSVVIHPFVALDDEAMHTILDLSGRSW